LPSDDFAVPLEPLFLALASGYSSAPLHLSWLIAFNVVNTRNPIVHSVGDFLYRVTEPLLRPIRNMLPNLGGIDVSPVILIIGLLFLERFIFWAYYQLAL
jgi:YggT family protein